MIKRKNVLCFGSSAVFFCLLAPLMLGGCTRARIPVAGVEVPVPNIPLPALLRGEKDLRGRSWSKAFLQMHERLVWEYAYSEHKGVDWPALYEEFAGAVLVAEESNDREAWYRAVRAYVHRIPDGNVNIDLNDMLRDLDVGASAGLALAALADESVIVCGLVDGGPAEAAGIAWGATIFAWDGLPMAEALAGAQVIWADNPAATPVLRRLNQLAWLPRGPEGSTHSVTYMNPGATEQRTAEVTLALDDYETLAMARPLWTPIELFSSPISTRVLPGDYRYVRVAAIAPTLSTPFPVRDFKAAIRLAVKEEAPGLLLDLRGTQGGDGSLVPWMLANFVAEESFLEVPAVWDTELETFLAETERTVTVLPEEPLYTGPIVLLVDPYTMGPAESLALFLKGRENVRVFGEAGTGGSPGVPDVELTLPGNYALMYPAKRSLNEAGQIQGVSDKDGVGGVEPDTLFVLDHSNAPAIFQEGKDAILDKAVEMLDSATWRFP